ncbi:MAG: FeoB small GTPase domain-containing protein, partial [Planctomycetota bacterium]
MRLRWRHRRRRGARAPGNTLTVALVGNPNSGKTTVFNRLTGLSQRVGNYPGVTVERKEGWCRLGDLALRLVDLPGTYSLAAKSPDEEVAVDVLLGAQPGERKPDLVLEIFDASSVERSLYLLSQVLETGIPVVVALTMVDVAEARGVRIDAARLSERIGAPFVPIVGHRGTGFDRLRAELERTAREAGARRGEIPGPALPLRA